MRLYKNDKIYNQNITKQYENKNDALIAPGGSYQSTLTVWALSYHSWLTWREATEAFLGKLFNFCYFCCYVCRGCWGKASQKGLPCAQLVSGWHVQDTQGSWYRQWDGYITNQHPEKAARWAFWIICGPKRQQAANQSDQRLTEGNVRTPFCCYTTFWLRNNMIFDLIHNKIIMISSRWYQGYCLCNCFKRLFETALLTDGSALVHCHGKYYCYKIIILLLFLNITVYVCY